MSRKTNLIHLDHVNFDKVLNVLDDTVAELVNGNPRDQKKQDLLFSIVFYIRMYPDKVHHPKEETQLFPVLLAKCPEVHDLIERLKEQHAEGESRIEALNKAINEFVKTPDDKKDQLREAADEFIAFQREHIGLEERELLPKAYEVLSDDDWDKIERAFKSNSDPVFGENIETGYQSLFKKITGQE